MIGPEELNLIQMCSQALSGLLIIHLLRVSPVCVSQIDSPLSNKPAGEAQACMCGWAGVSVDAERTRKEGCDGVGDHQLHLDYNPQL